MSKGMQVALLAVLVIGFVALALAWLAISGLYAEVDDLKNSQGTLEQAISERVDAVEQAVIELARTVQDLASEIYAALDEWIAQLLGELDDWASGLGQGIEDSVGGLLDSLFGN